MDSSDNYLRDYYEQLPSETAEFPGPGYSVQFNEPGDTQQDPQNVQSEDHYMQHGVEFDPYPSPAKQEDNQVDENLNQFESDLVEAPKHVEAEFAAPAQDSNLMSDPTNRNFDDDIISYDEEPASFDIQESVDIMGKNKPQPPQDDHQSGFDPVQDETEPKHPIMVDVQQQPQGGIMVFDEDELEDNPPQTVLAPDDAEDKVISDMTEEEEKEKEVEEEKPALVPDPVEEVLPEKPEVAPVPIKEEKHEEEIKPQIKQEAVEDIPQKLAPPDITNVKDTEEKEKPRDPVIDIVHWRDVKQSACILSFLLLVLGSLTCLSIISVLSYTGLALLTVTISFRFYKVVLQTLHGTQQPHPFQHLLDQELTISSEQIHKYADTLFKYVNKFIQSARSLFLVENTVNSLKLAVCLWLLTFIGGCFNGLTLVIAGVIIAFTAPPVYEKYQKQIDQYIGLANEKVGAIWSKVKAKIPALKPKTE